MSAIRNTNRSALRTSRSSPYARPADKKSSWSLSEFWSYLNPFRSFSPTREEPPEGATNEQDGGRPASAEPSTSGARQNSPATGHRVRFADLPESPPRHQSAPPATPAPPPPATPAPPPPSYRQPPQVPPPQQPRKRLFPPVTRPQPELPFKFDPSKLPTPPPPPGSEASLQPSDTNGSTSNRDTVVQYLQEAKGRKLNPVEIAGIVSLLKEDGPEDADSEPFRFQSVSPGPSATLSTSATPQPTKSGRLLAKNPNGVYKWQGAGSARPKHRYHSPGFGQPRASSSRIKLSPPKAPVAEATKRRRVGPDAETSTAQPVAPSPPLPTSANGPAAPITNGITPAINGTSAAPKMNGTSSLPRIHTSGPTHHHKATTPVRPSPLRQAWSSSEEPPSPPPQAPKQTRAAAFMQELIEEFSPKKSDVANPYQQMMPPRANPKKVTVVRKTRSAAAKEREEQDAERKEREEREREKQKQRDRERNRETQKKKAPSRLSGQAIIEATVPKGSKRARPPPELLAKSQLKDSAPSSAGAPSPRASQRLKSPSPTPAEQKKSAAQVEEVVDEEEPAAKKQKKEPSPPTRSSAQTPDIVEIDEDVDMSSSKAPAPSLFTQPSEVVEPIESTDRSSPPKAISPTGSGSLYGGINGTGIGLRPAFGLKSTAPKEPSKLRYSYQAESDGESSTSLKGRKPSPKSTSVPVPPVTASSGSLLGSSRAPSPAPANDSLFGSSAPSASTAASDTIFGSSAAPPPAAPSRSLFGSSAVAAPPPASNGPSFGSSSTPATGAPSGSLFDSSSTSSTGGSSTASLSGSSKASSFATRLANLGGTRVLRTGARAARSNAAPSPLGPPIDLESSVKAVKEASPVVDVKMVDAPKDVKQDALNVDGASLPVFNFTIEPSLVGSGSHLKAKDDALALPASSLPTFDFTKSAKASAPTLAGLQSTSGGFNWAAAGMKPPAAAGWTCSVCMVSNKADASKCVACEEPAPTGAAKGTKTSPPPASAPKGGFDWAAAGMKAPTPSGWTCSVCMVSNKADAVKCVACEEPAPARAVKSEPAKTPAAPMGGFNWAAAGMKPPEKTGTWLCNYCMCSSPGDADKCVVCEEPRL